LDEGGYVRYDESTAANLLDIMADLKERYGSLEGLYEQSSDTEDLEKRLQDFKGIGPVTSQIFLRELRGVWDADPEVSKWAEEAAKCLEIDLQEFEGEKLSRVEAALVKLHLRYCKREKCSECPMRAFCEAAEGGRRLKLRGARRSDNLFSATAPDSSQTWAKDYKGVKKS
jgi:endonuclease III